MTGISTLYPTIFPHNALFVINMLLKNVPVGQSRAGPGRVGSVQIEPGRVTSKIESLSKN